MTRKKAHAAAVREAKKNHVRMVVVKEGLHADEFEPDRENSHGYCPEQAKPILYQYGEVVETIDENGQTVPGALDRPAANEPAKPAATKGPLLDTSDAAIASGYAAACHMMGKVPHFPPAKAFSAEELNAERPGAASLRAMLATQTDALQAMRRISPPEAADACEAWALSQNRAGSGDGRIAPRVPGEEDFKWFIVEYRTRIQAR